MGGRRAKRGCFFWLSGSAFSAHAGRAQHTNRRTCMVQFHIQSVYHTAKPMSVVCLCVSPLVRAVDWFLCRRGIRLVGSLAAEQSRAGLDRTERRGLQPQQHAGKMMRNIVTSQSKRWARTVGHAPAAGPAHLLSPFNGRCSQPDCPRAGDCCVCCGGSGFVGRGEERRQGNL
jgi:hypothetical protein